MAKLSTGQLKALITGWLSTEESKEEVKSLLWRVTEENAANEAAVLGFKGIQTSQGLADAMFDTWKDGNNWKRHEKASLKSSQSYDASVFVEEIHDWKHEGYPKPTIGRKPTFPLDVLGWHDEALVKRYFDDVELAKKCTYRLFGPHDIFADNYRLEVITSHDDSEVVGWWVTVD